MTRGLAQTQLHLGVLGDSGEDEYQGSDNRGGVFHPVAFNWVEQLVKSRGVSVGVWGTYAEPRRTGFAYNWARSGATAASLVGQGQHTGLAAQVAAGQIDLVVISIGSNDFAPDRSDGYVPIYNGSVSGAALTAKINALVANVTTAVDTIQRARRIPIVLVAIPNWNNTPLVFNDPRFSDVNKRQRVADAIAAANMNLASMAQSRGIQLIDTQVFYNRLAGRITNGQLMLGGVAIQIFSSGDEPHHGLLSDNIHGGTVLEGLFANFIIESFNRIAQTGLLALSESEILANAGLSSSSTVNHAPQANDDRFEMTHGSSLAITFAQLLSNDTDADGDRLSIINGSLPKHGSIMPKADGTGGMYTPIPGFVGLDTFTYIAADGRGGNDSALVTIAVH